MKNPFPFVALSVAKSPLFSILSLRGAQRRGNPNVAILFFSLPSLRANAFVFCERGNPNVAILFFSLLSLRGAKRRGNPSLSVLSFKEPLK